MTNNKQDNDFSFLDKKDANSLSGKDIFFTIVRNIHWLLLCAAVGCAIAYYQSDRQDRIYESHAKIRLNSVTRSRLESGTTTLENITSRRVAITMNAINDEIIVLELRFGYYKDTFNVAVSNRHSANDIVSFVGEKFKKIK